jgi:hypothetical protein
MTRTSPPQVAFSSGEIDPLLHRRFDYQRFQTGMAACQGFLPLAQGGFTRAPGTIYRGRTRGDAYAVLIPFTFAANDALVLEFTALFMRVWRYGALVMTGASPFELATPFGADSLPNLKWVQSADVIYICDGQRPIQRLARLALNNWTIGAQAFDKGPFRVQNLDKAMTLQASAATGSVTLTANGAFFAANHAGSLIELKPTDNTAVPLWTSNEGLSLGSRRRYGENTYELIAGSNAGENPPIHEDGRALVDNAPTTWLFVSDSVGVVRITAFTNATTVTALVLKAVPQACVAAPTHRWSEGAWSARYGYPSTIELFDQRLVAAASPAEPRTVWFSTIGDFADFAGGTDADDAFAYTVAGEATVNRILNLRRGRTGLHIFALGEEYSTRSQSRNQAIGPTTAVFDTDSAIGSSPARPIAPDGNPIFISRDRRRVLQVAYDLQQDANASRELSLPAQHLGALSFEQIVWQSTPQPIAWLRRGVGDLVALIHDPSEEVLGWAPLSVAGGFVDGMAVCPDAGGGKDILTLTVVRDINGATVRCVEDQAVTYGVLTGVQPIAEACHFFCSVIFAPNDLTATFFVPHLVGASVHVWTDTGEFGPLTVPNTGPNTGIVTLPIAVGHAVIGLFDETHFAETLDVQAQAQDGNTMGRRKRLHSGIGVGLHRTAQGYIQTIERDFGQQPRVNQRRTLVPQVVASDLTIGYSGVVAIPAPTGHAAELSIRITPYSGAPLTITAIVPPVQEAGR